MKSWHIIRAYILFKAPGSYGRPPNEPSIIPTMTSARNTTNSGYCTKSDTRSWVTPPITQIFICSAWKSMRGYTHVKKHRFSASRSMKHTWTPVWKVTGCGCTSDQSVPDVSSMESRSLLPNIDVLCVVGSGVSPALSVSTPIEWIADR